MSPLRFAALFVCLVGCSTELTDSHPSDGGACCPITDNPLPGACVNLGGALPRAGSYCAATCDGPNDFVRTTDAKGCPKLVPSGCADGSADPTTCN